MQFAITRYWDYLTTPGVPSNLSGWGFHRIRFRRINRALYNGIPLHVLDLQEEFHRLANDEFPPLQLWPKMWRQIFFNSHKDRSDRYRLFVFLYQNGMPPHHAVYWTMWHCTYDSSAWNSILDAANSTLTSRGRAALGRNRVFNFYANSVV